MNKDQLDYQALPLLRLPSIYQDLLLKSQIATLDLSLYLRTREHPSPGRDYMEKIFAYRDWAKFALSLIKVTRD